MKINQIVTETTVSEAPGGSALGNLARKAGAKVAGAVGAKGTAAGMTGKVDQNARAKEIFTQYRGYMGQTGGNAKQPTKRMQGVQGQMTPKQVDDLLQGIAQDSFKGAAGQAAQASSPASLGDKFGSVSAQGGIPADLQKEIDALSPQDKAELAKLL